LTALTLNTVNAVELKASNHPAAEYHPSAQKITLAWDTTTTENAPGECKAVCMLPTGVD
jgi:hypothetical protein